MKNFRSVVSVGLTSAGLFAANLFCGSAFAFEYSVRDAFCQDYARDVAINTYSSQYDLQVAYNSCMRNANSLIRKHEAQKKQRQKEWEKRSEQRRQKALELQRQEELKRKLHEQKVESLLENADDLFR